MKIRNDEDYQKALRELEKLWDEEDSPAFHKLLDRIEAYENLMYPWEAEDDEVL